MHEKRVMFRLSFEAQELAKRLAKAAVGEVVRYEELSTLAMGDVHLSACDLIATHAELWAPSTRAENTPSVAACTKSRPGDAED